MLLREHGSLLARATRFVTDAKRLCGTASDRTSNTGFFDEDLTAPSLLRPLRMRVSIRPLLVCVLTLVAAPAAAQSTTEDGIRAFVGGDYQAAGRILKPLADDPARPDPA